MGTFHDFIAALAIAGPVCHVFGLPARAVSMLFGFVVVLFRPVLRLLGGDVGKFHNFIAAVAVLLCVSCLVCVCVVYIFYIYI